MRSWFLSVLLLLSFGGKLRHRSLTRRKSRIVSYQDLNHTNGLPSRRRLLNGSREVFVKVSEENSYVMSLVLKNWMSVSDQLRFDTNEEKYVPHCPSILRM